MKVKNTTRTLLSIVLLFSAVGFIAAGGRIYAKAALAQYLLEDAWQKTKQGQARVKPWSWADTWPVGRLLMPKFGIKQIVLAGASGRTMAFGPGHLAGTAPVGQVGNVAISGHRDTHFRWLKNVVQGDEIFLEGPDGTLAKYVVHATKVVDYRDTSPLMVRDDVLTLITCYPFDAVQPGGPLRYVVSAVRA